MTKQGDVKPIATQQRIPMGGYVLFCHTVKLRFYYSTHKLTNLKTHELNNSLKFPTP